MGGPWGHGVHVGGGGGGLWAGRWARARGGRGCGELSRRASPCGRPRRGAAGAGQSRPGSPGRSRCRGGRGHRSGPHPARRGRIPPSIIHGGESWWRRGGAPRRPLAAEPDRDGPRRMDTGGAGGAGHRGSGARGAGAGETGQAPGLWLVRGGVEGPGELGGEPREAPGGWAKAPEGGRSLRGGGGGLLLARGTTGAPLEQGGGGGRVSPGVGPCQFMAARHGTISPTLRAGVPFFWGGGLGGGGGGACGCCVHPPMRGGGSPVGAPSGLADKTRWRPLGSWAPSRKNLGFAGGDSAIGR